MMGLSNGVHWVAWFIDSFSVMLCSILLLLLFLRVSIFLSGWQNTFVCFLRRFSC